MVPRVLFGILATGGQCCSADRTGSAGCARERLWERPAGEEERWEGGRTDGRTDGRSLVTSRDRRRSEKPKGQQRPRSSGRAVLPPCHARVWKVREAPGRRGGGSVGQGASEGGGTLTAAPGGKGQPPRDAWASKTSRPSWRP